MILQYLFSSPEGDILLGPEDLARPFLIAPEKAHPYLTLKHYFESIRTFFLEGLATVPSSFWKEKIHGPIRPDDIQSLNIQSEKHGALYHIASVEVVVKGQKMKFAVSSAASDRGKTTLRKEYDILLHLNDHYGLPYLPEVYYKGDVECGNGAKGHEDLVMVLAEWFEGFHEWHYGFDQKENRNRIRIWDMKSENRFVSDEEAFDLLRQAAGVLTLYYDTQTFDQVHPWHHAAGDFIIKTGERGIDVRLITVRGYRSIMDQLADDTVNPIIALVYFFLNLTIRMRLDKLDGVGKTLWAEDYAVPAAVTGFAEALHTKKETCPLGTVDDFLHLLQSFQEEELKRLFQPLMRLYEQDDPEELAIIEKNLSDHIRLLHDALSRLPE